MVENSETRDANEAMVKVVAALMLALKAWIDFRSRECATRGYTCGMGTGGPAEASRCSIEITYHRMTYLQENW
jgi:uncharacterized protein YecT (DUF1311 family)